MGSSMATSLEALAHQKGKRLVVVYMAEGLPQQIFTDVPDIQVVVVDSDMWNDREQYSVWTLAPGSLSELVQDQEMKVKIAAELSGGCPDGQ